jgi:hypothetical protein
MIKPIELESPDGNEIWNTLTAAAAGDIPALRKLIEGRSQLARAEYWYTPAVHFAAREGHVDAVRLLVDAGADPERNGLNDRNLIEMAREHGHEQIAQLLDHARDRRGRVVAQKADHPIHRAAALGDAEAVSSLLDADASITDRGNRFGLTPLHLAALGGSPTVVTLLLDRGANLHAGSGGQDLQPIDLAVWGRLLRRSAISTPSGGCSMKIRRVFARRGRMVAGRCRPR